MHIFFYGRVSTLEQQEDGSALQKQLERGKAAGATRFYWDIISRSTETRPGLQTMMEDLQHFNVDQLIITRIDRIGSSSKLFYSLLGILRTNNIKLKALDRSSRTMSTPRKQQNVTENLQDIDFNRGKKRGNRRYPNGSLGWTPAGIKNWLVNPVHAGGIPRNSTSGGGKGYKSFDEWNVEWGTHEGIISREYHYKIKAIIRDNRSNHWTSRNMNIPNPYANLLKCFNCGGAVARCSIRFLKTKGYVAYFQCVRYGQGRCDCKAMLRNDKLEEQLQEHLVNKADAIASRLDLEDEQEEPPEITSLCQNLAQLEKCSPNQAIERAKALTDNKMSHRRCRLSGDTPKIFG